MWAEDDITVLADLPGWVVTGTVATFRPVPAGWLARVVLTLVPGRTYSRMHIAVVHPDGVVRYTSAATTVAEARRIAERQVRGRNG